MSIPDQCSAPFHLYGVKRGLLAQAQSFRCCKIAPGKTRTRGSMTRRRRCRCETIAATNRQFELQKQKLKNKSPALGRAS